MSIDQPRQPSGSPAGGQYAGVGRAEADLDLAAPAPEPTGYTIPEWALDRARARIEAANRRLERAGIEERFTYELSEPKVWTDEGGGEHTARTLTLSHPSIAYGGWSFAAALDATESGMIVRTKPGEDLGGWRPQESLCEHCGHRRHRSSTYLLRGPDGELKQVGSTCLENFLGVRPKGLWAIDEDPLDGIDDEMRGHASWGRDTSVDVRRTIAIALAASSHGRDYVSQSRAASGQRPSTSATVQLVLWPPSRMTPQQAAELDELENDAAATAESGEVDEVIATVLAQPRGSDYIDNLHTLLAGERVEARHVGLVASSVAAWARAKNIEQQRKAEAAAYTPGFLAPEKAKVAGVQAEITKVVYMDDPYSYYGGTNTLVLMRAASGHTLKWFASGRKDLEPGQKLALTGGSVKKHDTYEGKDQTVITRVKYEIEGEPDDATHVKE